MGYWKRHQRKEIEVVLEKYAAHGWTILDPPRYYTVRCPASCGVHQRQVHLTPSGANYATNLLAWGERQPCWKREEDAR